MSQIVPDAFVLAKSSVSRRLVGASAEALRQFHERSHDYAAWLVLLLDGKSFASDRVVSAPGVPTAGEKRVLGLVHIPTEGKRVCAEDLCELIARGIQATQWPRVALDRGQGKVSGRPRGVQRGSAHPTRSVAHTAEKVVSYLGKRQQFLWRRKQQAAYAGSRDVDAKRALQTLHTEQAVLNTSAARSRRKALRRHSRSIVSMVFAPLGTSFPTTLRIPAQTGH